MQPPLPFTKKSIPQFTNIYATVPTQFYMKELVLSVSHDDFSITDQQTNLFAFQIRRQLMSVVRQAKTLSDSRGVPLWICKHPLFKLFHRKYKFYAPDGRLLFIVRNHFRLPGQGKKLSITLPDGRRILSRGNLLDRQSDIYLENPGNADVLLATVKKPLVSARGVITGLSGYTISVQPNVDLPMCFAFVTILDEERERQGGFDKMYKAFRMSRTTGFAV